jgi:hypothetical protein
MEAISIATCTEQLGTKGRSTVYSSAQVGTALTLKVGDYFEHVNAGGCDYTKKGGKRQELPSPPSRRNT